MLLAIEREKSRTKKKVENSGGGRWFIFSWKIASSTVEKIPGDSTCVRFQVGQFEGQPERLNFGLVRVVYEWALEKPFAEIMDLTDVQEGIIVRCIQQLHEVRL